MAETLTDSLTGTLQVRLSWDRTDTQEVGTVTNRSLKVATYDVADGDGPGEADLVFTDTRAIPANTVEVIDLLTLTQQAFDVDVPFTFRQVRTVRVVNNETAAGRRILFGADPGRPQTTYAVEIGPGSEFVSINHVDAWDVSDANKAIQIANPNGVAVSYSIYLLGTSVQAPGGSGSGA
jgi:hypothetical protein